jgi:hypothetical protein
MRGFTSYGSADVQKYLAIAAIGLQPLEKFNLAMLEDDRWLLHAAQQRSEIAAKCYAITSLPESVFEALAEFIDGVSAWELRHCTFECMHLSLGYLELNGWELLRTTPLALTQGDIGANLEELLTNGKFANVPHCLQIQKISVCGRIDRRSCLQALKLLRDVSCSIGLMEKGHGPGSILRNMKKRLGPLNLITRSFVSLNASLFKPTKADVGIIEARDRWLNSLDSAKRVRFTAQNLFCSRTILEESATIDQQHRKHKSMASISDHNAKFAALGHDKQLELVAEAAEHRRQRKKLKHTESVQLHAKMVELGTKAKPRAHGGVLNTIDSLRLPADFVKKFVDLYGESSAVSSALHCSMDGRQYPPQVPDQDIRDAIDNKIKELHMGQVGLATFWWADILCTFRDDFDNCALVKNWDEVICYVLHQATETETHYKITETKTNIALSQPWCRTNPTTPTTTLGDISISFFFQSALHCQNLPRCRHPPQHLANQDFDFPMACYSIGTTSVYNTTVFML